MKSLTVNYFYNDKDKYRMPILCTGKDIGKIIYGKWIIGGETAQMTSAGGVFRYEPVDENEVRFYTAYKLVGGSFIQCNFELDLSQCPYIKFYGFDNWIEKKGDRGYDVDKLIDNFIPDKPNYDYHISGLRYIKMPA